MKYILLLALVSGPAFGAGFTTRDMETLAKVVVPVLSRCGDLYSADEIRVMKIKNKTSEKLNRAALEKVMKETLGDMVKFSDTAKLQLRTTVSKEKGPKKSRVSTYKLEAQLWSEGKMRCESSGEIQKRR